MADYYGDDEGVQPRPGPDTGPPESEETTDKEESEGQTALIPKSICPGHDLDVGDTVSLKIIGVHDQEYEVEYDEGGGKESESSSETKPETHEPEKPQRSRFSDLMD